MSRYTIPTSDPRYEVVCGWDNPMGMLFGQVWDVTVPPGTEDDEACVLWVGLTKRVETVAALQAALAAYVTLPAALVAQLEAERATAGPRFAGPRRQVPRREALAPTGPPPLGAEPAEPPHHSGAVTTARSATRSDSTPPTGEDTTKQGDIGVIVCLLYGLEGKMAAW